MRKGAERWVAVLIGILLTIAILAVMYLIGTGTITQFTKWFFSQG